MRSSNGCWTCRLRRKKCDETQPMCNACASLLITCHFEENKPEWMDGGIRQEDMAAQIKREIKDKAQFRRAERNVLPSSEGGADIDATNDEWIMLPEGAPKGTTAPMCSSLRAAKSSPEDVTMTEDPNVGFQRASDCAFFRKNALESVAFGRSDTVLLTFYLEHVMPFLFPFYRPSPFQGGRAWILEMMIGSPLVRQATLCQSSYFFSLARGMAACDIVWETVLDQTRDVFSVLRQALQVIQDSDIRDHLPGAVRIMSSIMQVQRFDITVLSFDNCQSHLNAALALFEQLLSSSRIEEPAVHKSRFEIVMDSLGPSAWNLPSTCIQIPSAEQAAFRFSSALLILDDIIASTVHQQEPRLYQYHHSLLDGAEGTDPSIDLQPVVGCKNWVLLGIGEIAALDAWKQQCKRAGTLDIMELVRRATIIKESLLEHRLTAAEKEPLSSRNESDSLLDVFAAGIYQQSQTPASHTALVTRIWAHAALLYLHIVVSGWQPASSGVQYHVGRVVDLLKNQLPHPELLRTMVWPFCVAGCLSEPDMEMRFRELVGGLNPPNIFGTARKALDIMESVWASRNAPDNGDRDLAACFKSRGDLILLI